VNVNQGTIFIVNPVSSSGRTPQRFEKLLPLIQAKFASAKIVHTRHPEHATEITRNELKAGAQMIVAVGGDGTGNEVINGFFENGQAISPNARLAILMSGTGGDFRRSIGIPKDLEAALLQIANGSATAIDVGLVNCKQLDGTFGHRYFLNASSLGLSALTALLVKERLGKQSRLAYLVAAFKALKRSKTQTLHLLYNGEKRTLDDISLLAFANGAFFGGAMHIAPNASITDGLADVISIAKVDLWMMTKNALKLYRGTHLSLKEVTHFQTSRLEVESNAGYDILVEADGEPCGKLPATFEILKGAIQLVR
jgi:diacylglycerol kinase (ATP)